MGHIHTHDRGVRYHFIIFSTILVLGMLASLMLGAVNISIPDIFRALFLDPENKYHLIIRAVSYTHLTLPTTERV